MVWIKEDTHCFSDSCVVKREEEEEKVIGEDERATAGEGSHLEADVLQVLGVLLDDLLNEVRVSGAQVRCSRLIELKFKSPPQVRRVKDVIPAAAHRRGPGPVDEGQMLEDLQDDVVGQVTPVLYWSQGEAGRPPLLSLSPLFMGGEGLALGFETCPSSFHSETNKKTTWDHVIRNCSKF